MAGILVYLTLCTCLLWVRGEPDFITKSNYGVLLTKVSNLDVANDKYHFTWAIKFPENLDLSSQTKFSCAEQRKQSTDNDTALLYMQQCLELENIVKSMYNVTEKLVQKVNDTISDLKTVLPKYSGGSITKRGLSFVGRFAEKAFDLVSKKTFNHLVDHVDYLEYRSGVLEHNLQRFGTALSSYMRIEDKRFTNLVSHIVQNNEKVTSRINKIAQTVNTNVNKFISNVMLYRFTQMMLSNVFLTTFDHMSVTNVLISSAESLLSHWLTGGQALLEGKLPISIVDASMVISMLEHVQQETVNEGVQIPYPDIDYYYHTAEVIALHTDSTLYIHVVIPLHTVNNIFEVFHVDAFMLATPDNSSSTLITSVPDFYAISEHNHYSIAMNSATYLGCSGSSILKTCKGPLRIELLKANNCINSIYLDNPTAVLQHCNISLFPQPPRPSLVQYHSHVILSSFASGSIICPDLHIQPIGQCHQVCVLKVPCGCRFNAPSGELPILTPTCYTNFSRIEQYYGHNLLFLSKYFPSKLVHQDFDGHTLFPTPLLEQLPEISPDFTYTLHDTLIDSDLQYSQDMGRIIDEVQSETANMANNPIVLPKSIFSRRSGTDLCAIFALLFAFASVLLNIYLIWRLTSLTRVVLVLQAAVHGANAYPLARVQVKPIPVFSTTSLPDISTMIPEQMKFSTSVLLWLITLLLALILVYIIRYYWFQKHTKVVLLIYQTKRSYVFYKLFDLNVSVKNLSFFNHGRNMIENIVIQKKSFWINHLHIQWKDLGILLNGITLLLPTRYFIFPWQVYNFRKLITETDDFCTLLLVYQHDLLVGYLGYIPDKSKVPELSATRHASYDLSDLLTPQHDTVIALPAPLPEIHDEAESQFNRHDELRHTIS